MKSQFINKAFSILKAFEKVLKNKWIEYSKYDYDFHKNLSYIDDGDITWIIRNEILATSTPID